MADSTLLIAQLSDAHVGTGPGFLGGRMDTVAALRNAVLHVAGLDPVPDVVLFTGDLTEHGRAEEGLLRDIRKLLKQDIAIENVAGFEPSSALRLDGPSTPGPRPPSGGRPHVRRPHAQQGRGNGGGEHAAGNKKRRRRSRNPSAAKS